VKSYTTIYILLLSLLIAIPILVYSTSEYVDPFTFSGATLSQIINQNGHVIINPFEDTTGRQGGIDNLSVRLFSPLLIYMLSTVLGINISTLELLPLDALFMTIIVIALTRRVFGSNIIPIFLVLFIFSNYPTTTLNMTYLSLGRTLIFFYVLVMTIMPLNDRKTVFILIAIFSAGALTYYHSELMILLFTFIPSAIYILNLKLKVSKRIRPWFFYLALSFLVIFIGLDNIVYQYLNWGSFSNSVNFFLGYISNGGNTSQISAFAGNPLWQLLRLNLLLEISFSILPILFYFALAAIHVAPKKLSASSNNLFNYVTAGLKKYVYIFLGFIIIGIAWAFVYVPLGYFDIGNIFWYFSIPSIMIILSVASYLGNHRNRVLKSLKFILPIFVACALLLSSLLAVYVYIVDTQNPYKTQTYGLNEASLNFVVSNSNNTTIASQSTMLQQQAFYQVVLGGKPDQIIVFGLSDSQFGALANGSKLNTRATIIIVPTSITTTRVLGQFGVSILPPQPNFFEIVDKQNYLDKIYDDGNNIVYSFKQSTP
jgi:hypothetical protein